MNVKSRVNTIDLLYLPNLQSFFKYGFLGVDLFFMISGYAIMATSLNRDIKTFFIARFLRLYYIFWVCVMLTTACAIMTTDKLLHVELFKYFINSTIISSWFGVKHIDSAYRTLVVEIKFYCIVGLILFCKQIDKIKYITVLWLLIIFLLTFFSTPTLVNKLLFPQWAPFFIS